MRENNPRELFEQELLVFANKHSIARVKVSTYNFDLDYGRNDDGSLCLVSEKAVIRALGKITRAPIGENEQYKNYEEAEAAVKKHWQEYYKNVRAKRSDKERLNEAKRQKRYRERRKAKLEDFKHRK